MSYAINFQLAAHTTPDGRRTKRRIFIGGNRSGKTTGSNVADPRVVANLDRARVFPSSGRFAIVAVAMFAAALCIAMVLSFLAFALLILLLTVVYDQLVQLGKKDALLYLQQVTRFLKVNAAFDWIRYQSDTGDNLADRFRLFDRIMRRVRRATLARKQCQVFKSHLDERYGGISTVGEGSR